MGVQPHLDARCVLRLGFGQEDEREKEENNKDTLLEGPRIKSRDTAFVPNVRIHTSRHGRQWKWQPEPIQPKELQVNVEKDKAGHRRRLRYRHLTGRAAQPDARSRTTASLWRGFHSRTNVQTSDTNAIMDFTRCGTRTGAWVARKDI